MNMIIVSNPTWWTFTNDHVVCCSGR